MGSNIFDNLRDGAFDVTLKVMGYDASWMPSDESVTEPYTARVHFKDPNEKEELRGVDFAPLNPFMEYRYPSFPGLYEAVRAHNGGEVVIIDGSSYDVLTVERSADGKTYKAQVYPVES